MTVVLTRPTLALVLLACTTGAAVAESQSQADPRELRWEELPRVVMGRKVAAVLDDGTRLEGKVRRVNPASLVLDIAKTSDPQAYPKGPNTIPCEAVSTLQLNQRRWRIAATLIGLGAGVGAGWIPALLMCGQPDSGTACTWLAWIAISGVSALVSYVGGSDADRRASRVRRVTCGGAASQPLAPGVSIRSPNLDWRSTCEQEQFCEQHCY